ncbi:MAG TPA: extracellular solute-binding protein, partial [Anaerolineales bacterium]
TPEVTGCSWDYSAKAFASGSVAMALGGTYESFFIREIAAWDEEEFLQRVGFVPVPAGPEGKAATLAGGMNYVLYHQSQQVKISQDMLKMTLEPQILKPFCLHTGQIPAHAGLAQDLDPAEDGFVAKTIPLLEQARTRPSLPDFARVSAQFRGMVEDCLTQKRPIDQAVTLAAERISAITDLPLG